MSFSTIFLNLMIMSTILCKIFKGLFLQRVLRLCIAAKTILSILWVLLKKLISGVRFLVFLKDYSIAVVLLINLKCFCGVS